MPGSDVLQSLTRGLDVLEMAARSEDGVALHEVAARLGVKPPTAHSVLRTLAARGFLERTPSPVRYRLGPAAVGLAEEFQGRLLVRQAEPALAGLFARIGGGTATLAEVLGGEVTVRLRVSAERPGIVEEPRGRTLHPYGSASSLLFQAFWTSEERAAYRQRHPFAEAGAHLWDSVAALDVFLAETRRLGRVALGPIRGDGIYRAAAPVFGPGGSLVAALGISHADGPDVAEPTWHRHVEWMCEAAARLSDAGRSHSPTQSTICNPQSAIS